MKTMIWPSEARISASTAFSRSSNSPRYFVPATSEPTSSAHTRFPTRPGRDVAGGDPLGQALDDRRLADAGLADQDGVVLRAPREHLDDAPHLLVPADDRIELAALGGVGQVAAELCERLVRALGVGRRHALPAAHLRDRLQDRGPVELGAGREREQQVLDGHVLVLQRLGLGEGLLERLAGRAARRRLHVRPLHARQRGEPGLDRVADRCRMEPGLLEDARGNARLLRQEREQQVVRGELGVAAGDGVALSRCEGLLGLYGEFREVHIAGGVGG